MTMARIANRKTLVLVGLVIVIFVLHRLAHQHGHQEDISQNEKYQFEQAKKYVLPSAHQVSILQVPTIENILDQVAKDDKLRFVFLVDRTEGYSYREETSTKFKESHLHGLLFVQLCTIVDKIDDPNTIFIQYTNQYNPWTVIVQKILPTIKEFSRNSENVVFISSKVNVNLRRIQLLLDFLQGEKKSNLPKALSVPRPTSSVERDVTKPDFVPQFFYPHEIYPPYSANDEFFIIAAHLLQNENETTKSLKFTDSSLSFLPIGVFMYNWTQQKTPSVKMKNYFIPTNVVALRDEVGTDLCRFRSNFATLGFMSREEIHKLNQSEPDFGFFCVPVLNVQVNYYLVALLFSIPACCCCSQILLFTVIAMAAPPRRKK